MERKKFLNFEIWVKKFYSNLVTLENHVEKGLIKQKILWFSRNTRKPVFFFLL